MRALIKQYAALTRISNLPTCWTNVLTGAAIGSFTASKPLAIVPVVLLSIIISLFYMAGMALNDLIDLNIDLKERPDRPIPSGRISPQSALIFVILLFVTAMALLLIFFPHCIYFALLLVVMIVLYDVTHKRFSFSVIFMAVCRALIYMIAAYAVFGGGTKATFWANAALASTILTLYIAFMTIIARSENEETIDKRRWLAIAIILLVPAAFTLSVPTSGFYSYIIAVILLVLLVRAAVLVFGKPPRIKPAVLTWLAGICLLDCLFLAIVSQPAAALTAGACFVITALSYRKIGGT